MYNEPQITFIPKIGELQLFVTFDVFYGILFYIICLNVLFEDLLLFIPGFHIDVLNDIILLFVNILGGFNTQL